jgi:hypothetical protein
MLSMGMGKGKGRFVLFVITGFVFLGAGSAGAIVWGLGRVSDEIRNAPGFAAGWAKAASSPILVEAIGAPRLAPFNLVDFVAGRQPWLFNASYTETTKPTENAMRTTRQERDEIEVPILGPRGSGSLKIEATQVAGGAWEVKQLQARLAGRAEAIDLLAPAAGSPGPASARDDQGKGK